MKIYGPNNPPKCGTARKIWQALVDAGVTVLELHYNSNCWGRGKNSGYGTWAGKFSHRLFPRDARQFGLWCGVDHQGVYVEQMQAPYSRLYISTLNDVVEKNLWLKQSLSK